MRGDFLRNAAASVSLNTSSAKRISCIFTSAICLRTPDRHAHLARAMVRAAEGRMAEPDVSIYRVVRGECGGCLYCGVR